jgi:hypothetical protein
MDGTGLDMHRNGINISDIRFYVSFRFPSPRIETDRIRIETVSDILDIIIFISLRFPISDIILIAPRELNLPILEAHAKDLNSRDSSLQLRRWIGNMVIRQSKACMCMTGGSMRGCVS